MSSNILNFIKTSDEEIEKTVNNFGYNLLNIYQGKWKRRVIIQDEIGYKYDVDYSSLKRHNGDAYFVDKGNPYTIENIKLFFDIENRDYTINSENTYINDTKKLSFYCFICKNNFISSWNRIKQGRKCGICSGHEVSETTSLAYLCPKYAKEWISSEHNLTPYQVPRFSNESVNWQCSVCDYKWTTDVSARKQCPRCCGKIVSDKNRLSILFPDIASEFHPTKNGNLTSDDFSFASEKKIWWLCGECGNEWDGKISERTRKNKLKRSKCKYCSATLGEMEIQKILRKYNIRFETETYFNDSPRGIIKPLPYDFYLPDYNLICEFMGTQHSMPVDFAGKGIEWAKENFKKIKETDKKKKDYCINKGINYLEISYRDFDNIENILIDFLNL